MLRAFVLASTLAPMKTLAHECDLHELQRRYAALCGDDRPVFGTMSAGMAVCHVRQAYRWAMTGTPGTLPYTLPVPRAVIKRIALYASVQWRPGVKTVLELEPGQPGTEPADFAADKAGLLAEMERFAVSIGISADAPDHAFFGTMSRADWLRWGYLHANHHLRQFGR
jgi:hypothetical protein